MIVDASALSKEIAAHDQHREMGCGAPVIRMEPAELEVGVSHTVSRFQR